MSDDWRVHAALAEEVGAHHLLKGLHEREIEQEVESQLPDRLPVTTNGPDVFVYAGDRAQAEQAAAVVTQILDGHGLSADISIACWHPEAEEWRPPDEGLPDTPEEQAAEHDIREAKEAEESSERGPQWEVRIDLPSHREALEIADRLEAEGLTPLRRWTHVFISAATEDDAQALADRLRGELPPEATIIVEGTAADAWRATHRFAILGGLAG